MSDLSEMMMRKALLTGIAALFLATGTAHATGDFAVGPSKQQIWRCGNVYIVINPIDLIWEYNRADFVRGGDAFTIWNNHLYQRYGQQNIPCEWPWKQKQPEFDDSRYLYQSKIKKYIIYLGGFPLVF